MATPLLELEGTGAEIAERLSDYADRRIHVIVLPVAESSLPKKDRRPIGEVLAETAAQISPEEVARLPHDFTDQLDHYLYGTPKR